MQGSFTFIAALQILRLIGQNTYQYRLLPQPPLLAAPMFLFESDNITEHNLSFPTH